MYLHGHYRTAQGQLIEQEKQLAISSKMAALGEMAAGIAHEINTPLGIISTLAETSNMLLENPSAEDLAEVRNSLAEIEHTVDRIAKIVRGLKSFARNESGETPTKQNAFSVLNQTLVLCEERFRKEGVDLRVSEKVQKDLQIICRETEISQVLLNLLNNSFDAIGNSTERWIEVDIREDDGHARFVVTDSGHGISAQIREKMFKPFFTTKEKGLGTGMGLALSAGITASHGGRLFYDDENPNTTFIVELPATQVVTNQVA